MPLTASDRDDAGSTAVGMGCHGRWEPRFQGDQDATPDMSAAIETIADLSIRPAVSPGHSESPAEIFSHQEHLTNRVRWATRDNHRVLPTARNWLPKLL